MIEYPKQGIMTSEVSMFHDVIPLTIQIAVHLLLLASNLLPVLIFFKSRERMRRSTETEATSKAHEYKMADGRHFLLHESIDHVALYCSAAEVTCSTLSIFFLFASRYHDIQSPTGSRTCLVLQLITIASQLFKTALVSFTNLLLINACLSRTFSRRSAENMPLRRSKRAMIVCSLIFFVSLASSMATSGLQVVTEPPDSPLYCPNQILQTSAGDKYASTFFWSFMIFNLATLVTFLFSLVCSVAAIFVERRHLSDELNVLEEEEEEEGNNFSFSAALIFSSLHHLFWMPVLVLIIMIHNNIQVSRFSCESAFFVAQMSSLLHPLVFVLYLKRFKQEAARTILHLCELFLGCPCGGGEEEEDETGKDGNMNHQKNLPPVPSHPLPSISYSSLHSSVDRLKINNTEFDTSMTWHTCSINPGDAMLENDVIAIDNEDTYDFEDNSAFWFNLADDEIYDDD